MDLINFYKDHLKNVLLPFWINRAIDYKHGGYYTCFDNSGKELVSHDKYTWSQGRMVWSFSRLSRMDNDIVSKEERVRFLELAELGASFLMKNCLLDNGNCAFVMDRYGNPKTENPDGIYDTSIYADCF